MAATTLYRKMVEVMDHVKQLEKDGSIADRSGKHMYSYLSEEKTTSELQRAFIKIGLVLFPVEVLEELFYIEGSQYDKPFKNAITKVIVKYKLADIESGQFEIIESIGYGSDSTDKGSNKAMTSAFKYAQRQSFMISTGDDSDHESELGTAKKILPDTPLKPAEPSTLDKLAQQKGKMEGDKLIPQIKEQYKLLTPNHDLIGFETFLTTQMDSGFTHERILGALKKKVAEKITAV